MFHTYEAKSFWSWRNHYRFLIIVTLVIIMLFHWLYANYADQSNQVQRLQQENHYLLIRAAKADQVRALMAVYGVHDEEIVSAYMNQPYLDPYDGAKIGAIESQFFKYAVSRTGAKGVMQISDCWRLKHPFNIKENINFGCWLFSYYLKQYGSVEKAIQAYNSGVGTLQYSPCFETRLYIYKWFHL